jgi:putative ABC transport system ATP-binding protein
MTQPRILFADEPTGNLDQQTAENVIELLFDMNQKHGTTLVLITHDSKLAERCDRTLTINAGCIKEVS